MISGSPVKLVTVTVSDTVNLLTEVESAGLTVDYEFIEIVTSVMSRSSTTTNTSS